MSILLLLLGLGLELGHKNTTGGAAIWDTMSTTSFFLLYVTP